MIDGAQLSCVCERGVCGRERDGGGGGLVDIEQKML